MRMRKRPPPRAGEQPREQRRAQVAEVQRGPWGRGRSARRVHPDPPSDDRTRTASLRRRVERRTHAGEIPCPPCRGTGKVDLQPRRRGPRDHVPVVRGPGVLIPGHDAQAAKRAGRRLGRLDDEGAELGCPVSVVTSKRPASVGSRSKIAGASGDTGSDSPKSGSSTPPTVSDSTVSVTRSPDLRLHLSRSGIVASTVRTGVAARRAAGRRGRVRAASPGRSAPASRARAARGTAR